MVSFSKQNKQVVILYLSTILGVVLGILSSIINTRFLPPNEYGDVRYVQNIIQFVSSLLLFGYFLSGSRLLALSYDTIYCRRVKGVMVLILCAAVAVLMLCCFVLHCVFYNKLSIAHLFWISIPVCAYPLLLNYINTTAQGDSQIGRLSIARLFPCLFYVPVAYLVYSHSGASASKLILLQWGIYLVVCMAVIISTKPLFGNLRPIWDELKLENKSYGFQLYLGSLVMVATNYLAGITLGAFYDDNSNVGFYTLALTITSPLATLPAIIGTTYFKKFATLPCIPSKVMKFTLVLTLFSCILFIFLIKPLVLFLYSNDYASVGIYASWLSIGYSIHGVGDMINRYLGSHGMGKEIRNSSIYNGIVKVLGYIVLVYFFGIYGAIITTIACSIIYTAVLSYYYSKFIHQEKLSC